MKCMRRPMIEAYALGHLAEAEAREMGAHLDGCATCARDADRFEVERSLFTRRAALPAPALPAFAEVLARATARPAKKLPRAGLWSSLAAAAVLVIGVAVAGRAPPIASDESASIVAEPTPAGATCEDPRAVADHAATREEQAYGACLAGTPNCAALPPEPPRAEPEDTEGEGCSVTCEACEPHPGEVLESGTRGDRGP